MEKPLPPDVVENILETVMYFVAAAIGWLGKWLSGRKKSINQKNDAK